MGDDVFKRCGTVLFHPRQVVWRRRRALSVCVVLERREVGDGVAPEVIRSARPRSPAFPLPLSTFPFSFPFESAMTMSPFDMLRESGSGIGLRESRVGSSCLEVG